MTRPYLTRLGLASYDIQELAVPEGPVGVFTVSINLDGVIVELELAPHSVRSEGFRVSTRDARGTLHPFPLPAPTTYRGRLRQHPGSIAAASIINGRLRARIVDGDSVLVIQPLDEVLPEAGRDQYVLFHRDDEIALDAECGTDLLPPRDRALVGLNTFAVSNHCPSVAELAFEADVEFFLFNSSDMALAVADIESIVNALNVIYIRDVLIIHEIVEIIVQTAEPDLLDSLDPGTLLDEFRALWNAEHSPGSSDPITRDIAHLMTGKNLTGSIVGIAFGAVLCDNLTTGFGYGLSQTNYTANYDRRVALTAHEIGHNWDAIHCNGDADCAIMCSTIGGCTPIVDQFGSRAIADITSYLTTVSCLTILPPPLGPDCNVNCIEDFDDILIGISQDCTGNGVPDECDIASGIELDCNLDGIPDSCEPDCNGNLIADECDISSGLELDCNANGIPDSCEDCNGNGIADECDVNVSYFAMSGNLSPIDWNTDATHLFLAPPQPIGMVTIEFTVSADLITAPQFIEVYLNGLFIGNVLAFPSIACPSPPDFDQILMLPADFDGIVGPGDADFLMIANNSDPLVCGPASFITVSLTYAALSPFDLNVNGVVDSCECPADCDSGIPDGDVNVGDLLELLANWGSTPAFCDIDPFLGNGIVNVSDLLELLAAWGACP